MHEVAFECHWRRDAGEPGAPTVAASPDWLLHFQGSQWKEEGGLDAKFFRRKLQKGPALLLLDGLDEASSEKDRASLVKWIEVVTSRPTAYIYPQGSTPDGIADLAGNVWEWCLDRLGDYPDEFQKNPTGPKKGEGRVLRGGAWDINAGDCRCSYRGGGEPSARDGNVGFRVVLVCSWARTKKRKP